MLFWIMILFGSMRYHVKWIWLRFYWCILLPMLFFLCHFISVLIPSFPRLSPPYFTFWLFSFNFVVCILLMPSAVARYSPAKFKYKITHTHTNICTHASKHLIYIMEWLLKFRKHIKCVMWRIFRPLFIYLFRLFSLSFVQIVWHLLTFPPFGYVYIFGCAAIWLCARQFNREYDM